jgi:hypothetical protein
MKQELCPLKFLGTAGLKCEVETKTADETSVPEILDLSVNRNC